MIMECKDLGENIIVVRDFSYEKLEIINREKCKV